MTSPVVLLTVTEAPGPAPGAGTVTAVVESPAAWSAASAAAGLVTGAEASTSSAPSSAAVVSAQATRQRAPGRGVHPFHIVVWSFLGGGGGPVGPPPRRLRSARQLGLPQYCVWLVSSPRGVLPNGMRNSSALSQR